MDENKLDLTEYVLENFDAAQKNEWIKVYYQPVIRTLSRELCGMEALARWDDPVHGLLSPGVFIPVLESAGRIHELDIFMLQMICRDYRDYFKKNSFLIPVSMNLSRADFDNTDIFAHIIRTVGDYAVPRELLHLEITESMLGSNQEFMVEQIKRFHDEGFQVWMDDFGSEYSSLNSLKDYDFDELKIDMRFLNNFSVRSQKIIAAVVNMAKQIGIKTLAEGVETEEQFEFLRSIGCEKTQGFYFGRPMPKEQLSEHLKEHSIDIEPLSKRKYYTQIGKVNFLSPTPFDAFTDRNTYRDYIENQIPLAIAEYANDKLKFIFQNDAFKRELKSMGVKGSRELEALFRVKQGSVYEKFKAVLTQAATKKKDVGIDFVRGEDYCAARVCRLASFPQGMAFLITTRNLSNSGMGMQQANMDASLRSILSIYNRIDYIDVKTWKARNLYQSSKLRWSRTEDDLSSTVADFAKTELHPDDRHRYLDYMDMSTLADRMRKAPEGRLSNIFRVKTVNGEYIWTEFDMVYESLNGEEAVLSCLRHLSEREVNQIAKLMGGGSVGESGEISGEILWRNFVSESDIALFWKDRDRRFLGVNQTFLDYYNMESSEELIGKNDEEMGWHVDPDPFKNAERRVIESGDKIMRFPGKCIKGGIPREIAATKVPVYDANGKIQGLLGYFVDLTQLRATGAEAERLSFTDDLTGLLNLRGLMENAMRYIESYHMRRIDFAVLFIDIKNFKSINEFYGLSFGDKVLIAAAHIVRDIIGVKGIVSRIGSDHFISLVQYNNEEEIEIMEDRIRGGLSHLHYVGDEEITLYVSVGSGLFSESEDMELLRKMVLDRTK